VNIPIVTLDKIYIQPDNETIYFLDCTRVDGSNEIISRKKETLDIQLERLCKILKGKDILLADDVVFTGSVLKQIINRFTRLEINVVGIISSICTESAYQYFNELLKYGLRCNYRLGENVIDQICERDFYFGIAGSGIMMDTQNGLWKSPYFKPYGNPCERASIPEEYEKEFSKNCLERSIYLWEEIEKLKKQKIVMKELPERIINTKPNQEVVKVLKKEMNRL
jgi:hypothetical protein